MFVKQSRNNTENQQFLVKGEGHVNNILSRIGQTQMFFFFFFPETV